MTGRTASRRRRPADSTRESRRDRPAETGTRLPWWALLLPVLAFTVLLGLHFSGGPADLAEGRSAPSRYVVADIVERVWQLLPG